MYDTSDGHVTESFFQGENLPGGVEQVSCRAILGMIVFNVLLRRVRIYSTNAKTYCASCLSHCATLSLLNLINQN